MCGIVGLFLKDETLEPKLGALLANMLGTMRDRGPDSTGFAVYGPETPGARAGAPQIEHQESSRVSKNLTQSPIEGILTGIGRLRAAPSQSAPAPAPASERCPAPHRRPGRRRTSARSRRREISRTVGPDRRREEEMKSIHSLVVEKGN